MFELDERLSADSLFIASLKLSQVRLMNDTRYPWLILIPQRPNLREIIDLQGDDQQLLLQEISQLSHLLKTIWNPFKINVAALGNVVAQLHIHVIARFENDFAWPNPIWNCGTAQKYLASDAHTLIMRLQKHLEQNV